MKHTILIFVCLSVAFFSYSQQMAAGSFIAQPKVPSFTAEVGMEKQDAVILQVNNPHQKSLNLQIQHFVEGVVVDTVIKSKSYRCRYRFNKADEGRYTVQIRSGKERYIKTVDVSNIVSVEKRVAVR